ncbi:hypothetical protein chiPu_0019011 [Chiloscyllium punctatum]|uniref:Immunoglobulin C1-set domain-containing protein n=1 Tax=Chiloscyllium punctatum TaxID=137246 RepID=A0A401RQF0_CHIPU|nr:hypothetical protein [Chiloscyllium punctatum]
MLHILSYTYSRPITAQLQKGTSRDTEKLLFGNGTRLIVRPKEKDVTGPKLSVFYPPVTPENDLVPATVCLADDFFPKTIQLSLKVEGHNQTTMTKSAIVTDDGYYRASNFLPVPSGQSNLIICEAKHEDSHFIVNVTTGGGDSRCMGEKAMGMTKEAGNK